MVVLTLSFLRHSSSVMGKLYENEKMLNALESKIKKKINIKMQDGFYPEYFEIL